MPSNPVPLANVTDALIAMLQSVTGKQIGDGEAPLELSDGEPYAFVQTIPGGYHEGDASNPDTTCTAVYQVTSIGATRWQAEAMRDLAHRAILARFATAFTNPIDNYIENEATKTLAALGWKVAGRTHDSSGGVMPEGVVFNAHERYELWVVPV